MWFSREYLPFVRQLDQLVESFRERRLQFLRIVGLSPSAITKSLPDKVGTISFDPLNMTELALQLKALKAEFEPHIHDINLVASLYCRPASIPQCGHVSPELCKCIKQKTYRTNQFEDANINHTFDLLRPLLRCDPIS